MNNPIHIVIAVIVGLLSTQAAQSISCFGGTSNRYVQVEICRSNPNYCHEFCVPAENWDTPQAEATLRRFIIAVGNGELTERDVRKELPKGLRAGTNHHFGSFSIYTKKLRDDDGNIQ